MKTTTRQSVMTLFTIVLLISLTVSAAAVPLTPLFSQKMNGARGEQKISDVISMIDENLIREHLLTLVGFGPRMTGTYGCEKAAQYIHQQFTNSGLQTRYQNWTAWGNIYYHHIYSSQNVEGTLPGTDITDPSAIIFNAHYDSVAAGVGANDDGSGTVAVLAAAYALSHFDFKRTLTFVTFSGEETGLLGSRAYAQEKYSQNDSILVEINADMIGHDEGSRTMTVTATEDAGWVADIFQMINTNYSIGLTVNKGKINRVNHGLGGSDYSSFLGYGWETVCCWESDHDPNFHSAADNFSNVNLSYLVNTTRNIAGALAYLADIPETPPQVRIISPRIGYFYNEGMKKRQIGEFRTTVLDDIWVWAEIEHASVPILRADFYYDGRLVYMDIEAPFIWHFNRFSLKKHDISVIVYDAEGRNSSDWRSIRFINLLLNR